MKNFYPLSLLLFLLTQSFYLSSLQVDHLTYQITTLPGQSHQNSVLITNDTDHDEHVVLHLVDYRSNHKGEHFFDEPCSYAFSNSSWIDLSHRQIDLQPHEQKKIYYRINTPMNELSNGSYWSVLLIEPTTPINTFKDESSNYQLNIKLRFAHHIVTSILPAKPELKILGTEIQRQDNRTLLLIKIENRGRLFTRPKLTLKVFQPDGTSAGLFTAEAERLYPSNSQKYLIDISQLETKKYRAFLLLDGGDKHLFGEKIELSLDDS